MATQADVRRIALEGTVEAANDFAFSVPVKGKSRGYAWVWKERVVPKKPRVPNHSVLAVRVANLVEKDLRISREPDKYFTEPCRRFHRAAPVPFTCIIPRRLCRNRTRHSQYNSATSTASGGIMRSGKMR